MNIVVISGRLGKDPELKTFGAGTKKVDFSIANKLWAKDGVKTVWINIRVIGKRAEAVAANLTKGRSVTVTGTWQADEWKDKTTGLPRRYDYVFASLLEWDAKGAAEAPPQDDPDDDGGY